MFFAGVQTRNFPFSLVEKRFRKDPYINTISLIDLPLYYYSSIKLVISTLENV